MHDRSGLADRLNVALASLALPLLLLARLPAALDGHDAVDFALALREWDPGLDQPHLPGYPLFIVLARGFARLGAEEAAALALPGVLAACALPLAVARVARAWGLGLGARRLAPWFTVLHPLIRLEGSRPMSDLLGTCAAWSSLACVAAARDANARAALAGGILLGLGTAVRIDLLPFACAGLALRSRHRTAYFAGLAGSIALWSLPFAASLPPEAAAGIANFASGHFTRWGSSALAGAGSVPEALRALGLLGAGGGAAALSVAGVARIAPAARRWLALAVVPYTLWVALGQNLAEPRHWLPLAPALALLSAAGWQGLRPGLLRRLGLLLCAASALFVHAAAIPAPRDGRALVERSRGLCQPCAALYMREDARLFDRYAPAGFPVYRRGSLASIRRDLRAWGVHRGDVWISDEFDLTAAGPARRRVDLGSGRSVFLFDAAALR